VRYRGAPPVAARQAA